MPCYPGTGHPRETGVASNVVNCALSPGSGSVAFRDAWRNTILPKLRAFQPELIIVSAGYRVTPTSTPTSACSSDCNGRV